MKRNEASADRIIRVVLAALLAAMVIMGIVEDTWAIVLGILSGILLVTAITGFCAIYALLGISTNSKKTIDQKN